MKLKHCSKRSISKSIRIYCDGRKQLFCNFRLLTKGEIKSKYPNGPTEQMFEA